MLVLRSGQERVHVRPGRRVASDRVAPSSEEAAKKDSSLLGKANDLVRSLAMEIEVELVTGRPSLQALHSVSPARLTLWPRLATGMPLLTDLDGRGLRLFLDSK